LEIKILELHFIYKIFDVILRRFAGMILRVYRFSPSWCNWSVTGRRKFT